MTIRIERAESQSKGKTNRMRVEWCHYERPPLRPKLLIVANPLNFCYRHIAVIRIYQKQAVNASVQRTAQCAAAEPIVSSRS